MDNNDDWFKDLEEFTKPVWAFVMKCAIVFTIPFMFVAGWIDRATKLYRDLRTRITPEP